MKTNADVIIIGGGIIGCSTAYYLAKKGKTVIVLEKGNKIGYGGSGRNGGGVRQSGRDKRELPLAMYGVQNLWPHLSEELGTDVEYYQWGNLRLGKTDEHLEILQGLTDVAVSLGLDVKMISGEEVREICPHLSDEVIGASWCQSDGHANPLLTTLAFYNRANALGVRFFFEQSVLAVKKVGGRARTVVTTSGEFEAEKIVLAAGYESQAIAKTCGVEVPVKKIALNTLITDAQPPMFYQMLGTAMADFYGHQTTHGSFIFGAGTPLDSDSVKRVTDHPPASATAATCKGILSYIPALKYAKVVRSWVGFIDWCEDKVPVIDHVEGFPGLILAFGFSGHGFGIAPSVGTVLSEMACDETPSIDISELNYGRFSGS
ncbi:FAD-binding oxidoreductase [uncultured Desulfobacter sp.]|uniref:NAD(P)/FAD-dependent oxidoreductase n=1 Tax=uncultured Desulfobacter sp. TaxID=240139 RepID=UPI0029F555D1|nr:FAD-binding oxidoreductase [uncultured Desulfobacter sp.]